MPKIVDHEARRAEIVNAVWQLVSRDGIAAATMRNIAKQAGCSNGILSHYFADKADILHAALLLGYRRTEEQVLECLGRAHGLEALREVLGLTLALTDEKLLGNKVELAYRGEAVGNARIAAEHYETYARFRAIVRRLVAEARHAGEISAEGGVDVVADLLVALIDGLGMEAALFPSAFPRKRQSAIVDAALAGLAVQSRRARSRRSSATRRSARPAAAPASRKAT